MWEYMEPLWCECMEIDDTVRVEQVSRYWYSPKVSHPAAFRRGPETLRGASVAQDSGRLRSSQFNI
jgi:hypothetical protein